MTAYYNEIDPYAAAWLRNLIAAGHIAKGDVDERSIEDVIPSDLSGYTQCHFFAGIGGWSAALRLAGWSDDRPVWTGSCPCQPFSAAGKQEGFADERHLWPAWFWLIRQRRPRVVFGEQVAAKAVLHWLDLVHSDLEGAGYAVGAVDLCAAGVGAPHIRQRFFFVADSLPAGRSEGRAWTGSGSPASGSGSGVALGDANDARPQGRGVHSERAGERPARQTSVVGAAADIVGESEIDGRQGSGLPETAGRPEGRTATSGFWDDADWLPCIDGKARPVEPGTFPLAHGATARVGRLRAYGNAIVPQVAAAFIEAFVDSQQVAA